MGADMQFPFAPRFRRVHLWAAGVAAVICGDFVAWQPAFGQGRVGEMAPSYLGKVCLRQAGSRQANCKRLRSDVDRREEITTERMKETRE